MDSHNAPRAGPNVTQLWAYRDPNVPGIIIIPAPPINYQFYPYAESLEAVENETFSDSNEDEDEDSLKSNTNPPAHGVPVHPIATPVPSGVHNQNQSRHHHDSHLSGEHANNAANHVQPDPSLIAPPLGSIDRRRVPPGASDHAHTGHDADDSFFLHGTQSAAPPQNSLLRPPRLPTPVHAELQLSADYVKMVDMGSSTSSEPDTPMGSYMSKVSRFVKDVKKLPWTRHRPTVDYYPGRGHRRFHFHSYSADDWYPNSWYALLHRQAIDLLSSESDDGSRSPGPDSALASAPHLSYGYYRDPSNDTALIDYFPPIYPFGGYVPQPAANQNQNQNASSDSDTTSLSSDSVPMHGPPIPSDMAEDSHSFTLRWPPPPPVPDDA